MPRPFDTGSQYGDWYYHNCRRAWKEKRCAIACSIALAYLGDGQVSDRIAERMGFAGAGMRYTWDCPSRQEHRPRRPVRQHRARPGQLSLLEVVANA